MLLNHSESKRQHSNRPTTKYTVATGFITLLLIFSCNSLFAQAQKQNEPFLLERVRALNLDSLQKGTTTVHFTPGYRNRAEMLGARTERALQFFKDSLNIDFGKFHLIMPDTSSWKELSVMPYGFAVWGRGGWQHRNLGKSVSGRPASAIVSVDAEGVIFRQLQNLKKCLSNDDHERLNEIGYSLEEASRRYVEIITIHELGHGVVENLDIKVPTVWYSEFLANYFTVIYLYKYEPKEAKIWDLMTAVTLDCYTPEKSSLEVFYLPGKEGPEYHWLQSNLIQRANKVAENHGFDFIREAKTIFSEQDSLSQKVGAIYNNLDRLPKEEVLQRLMEVNEVMIERLDQIAPGFQVWATNIFEQQTNKAH
ncbi:hypothetical protein NC796_24270 [Aliifodinibius sp. S!AR15-10]|uniref:hypothetical protein n=1 Tax=Aliifodinibius sp. S!AR15-10 TaxID=2950437 RepID=UPI002855CA25|nr:hypothetical protein [Aliifodinibius sp. S!AR15-10]MDR8394286.1 hypothetical protein [Aliifodinibius sp. S!AR15-10]